MGHVASTALLLERHQACGLGIGIGRTGNCFGGIACVRGKRDGIGDILLLPVGENVVKGCLQFGSGCGGSSRVLCHDGHPKRSEGWSNGLHIALVCGVVLTECDGGDEGAECD